MTVLENLKRDLSSNLDLERVFQRHVVDGTSYFFQTIRENPNEEYSLRHELAQSINLDIHDVIMVGSAKLGFSTKNKKFTEFDSKFETTKIKTDKSDLDIAIVSQTLFTDIAQQVFQLSDYFNKDWIDANWKYNEYYLDRNDLFEKYISYLAKGWLRPDFLPNKALPNAPWKLKAKQWRNRLDRKVSVAFYANWFYLKSYQISSLSALRAQLQTGTMQ